MSRWLPVACLVLLPLQGAGCAAPAEAWEQYRWEHEQTSEGVALYTSEVTAHSFEAVKGMAVLPFAATPIFMSLYDFVHYPRWYYHSREVRVLSVPRSHPAIPVLADGQFGTITAGGPWLLFFRQETPPLDDRWSILRCTYRAGERRSLFVEFESIERYPFKAPDATVRMHLHGFWRLRPIDAGHTEVTFMLDVDPDTATPAFLVNPVLRDTVRETILGLARQLPAAARSSSR